MKLRLLTWNIWGGTHFEGVVEYLRTAGADIIALQEVVENERGNSAELIAKEFGYECVHVIKMNLPLKFLPGNAGVEGTVKFGTAILSKFPIVSSESFDLSPEISRFGVRANILINDIIFHVFSIHLKHSHFQEPLAIQDTQVGNLITMAPKEKTIIMGDFNAVPESSVIQTMSQAFTQTDSSNHPTWPLYREGCSCSDGEVPKHKIDHIFVSTNIRTVSSEVGKTKASDHLPVLATVEI